MALACIITNIEAWIKNGLLEMAYRKKIASYVFMLQLNWFIGVMMILIVALSGKGLMAWCKEATSHYLQ